MGQESTATYQLLLMGSLAALYERGRTLRSELADVQEAIRSMKRVLADHDAALGGGKEVTLEELGQCGSQPEGLRLIGKRSGGRIRLRDAVQLIHQSDLTTAKLPSLRATLYRYVKTSPEWNDEGNGVFSLAGFEPEVGGSKEGTFRVHHATGESTEHRFRLEPGGSVFVDELNDEDEKSRVADCAEL